MGKGRKIIALLLAVLVIALALSACSRKEETQQASVAEPVTIEFMHSYTEEDRLKVIGDLITRFQEENENITVKQVPVAEDAFGNKLIILMQGKQLPAVIDVSVDQARLLHGEGVIDQAAADSVVDAIGVDNFYKGAIEVLKDENGMFGVPLTGWVQGIWYRTDLFEEKGLNPPEKWADILAAAEAFTDKENRKYGIVFATEASSFTEQTFSQFALSNNAVMFDADGNPQFNSDAMKEAVNFYKQLYQYSPQGSNGFTQVVDAFTGGFAAMAVYSTYILGTLFEQDMLDKVGFAVPDGVAPAAFGMISTQVITNTVPEEQREAASKFLTFLLQRENYIDWMHMAPGGPNPILKGISTDPEYLDVPLLTAMGDTAKTIPDAFENLKMFGFQNGETNPFMGEISNKMIIGTALNNILVQNADVESELDAAQKQMEEIIN